MFDMLPEECEDLIFQFHNKNIEDMNREHHKKKFNLVLDQLQECSEDCIYYYGLQDYQEHEYLDLIFSAYLLDYLEDTLF